MKKLSIVMMLLLIAVLTMPTACKKDVSSQTNSNFPNGIAAARGTHTSAYPADVANAWMKMQIHVMLTTGGIPHVAYIRPYAYSGIVLYESLLPGMPSYQTLV